VPPARCPVEPARAARSCMLRDDWTGVRGAGGVARRLHLFQSGSEPQTQRSSAVIRAATKTTLRKWSITMNEKKTPPTAQSTVQPEAKHALTDDPGASPEDIAAVVEGLTGQRLIERSQQRAR